MQKNANPHRALWGVCPVIFHGRKSFKKLLLAMKLTTFFLTVLVLHAAATGFSQTITFSGQQVALKKVLTAVEKQTPYLFFYNKELLTTANAVTVTAKEMPLHAFLQLLFEQQPVSYRVDGKNIILSRKPAPAPVKDNITDLQQDIRIAGIVKDADGLPLSGATITIKNSNRVVALTDDKGAFTVNVPPGETLVISYLGFEKREIKVVSASALTILLQKDEKALKDVIVTGMMLRKKTSSTGATASFTGDQLKTLGNQNIIQSLRSLDPSIVQIENNLAGSNPNVLPTLELRGQTSIVTNTTGLRDQFSRNPNQPLFILDGFETDLRTIVDMDMNMVASITILKDAASTAIYGSRASNGVIVVETQKPQPGRLKVSYTSDLNIELPDLSSYHMMNAAEKMYFEKLSGAYIDQNGYVANQLTLDTLYSKRMKEVARGVNTYWLNKPLRTGFSQRHAVSATGGDQQLRYNVGANYKNIDGTMLGSNRKEWGANLNIIYHSGKVTVGNNIYVSGAKSQEASGGSFSTWVNTNPYYRVMDASQKYLEQYATADNNVYNRVPNPFYNASLPSFGRTDGFNIQNNLQLSVDLSKALRFQANAQVMKTATENNIFVSPLNTAYDKLEDPTLKGDLTHSRADRWSYTANAALTYAKVFAGTHSLTAYLRTEVAQNKDQVNGYKAKGFPNASNGNPAFAYGFPDGSVPDAATLTTRRNSFVAAINYSYDQRYNIDLNMNMDGSTAFGSNRRYAPYYSGGVSWNLHNEAFIKGLDLFNVLRLRGNMGLTGNQNFGNVSQSVYNYYSTINSKGLGVYLSALGAPNLEWQSTLQTSVGMDVEMLNNRLIVQLNGYHKLTDPLVVAVNLPSSTGLSTYPFNAGNSLVKGWEATVSYAPIYQPGKITWTLGITGAGLTQRYNHFDNLLSGYNKQLRESNALNRYRDGYSANDLWAVPSLGIDPATGQEVFLKKNGQQTFTYDANDQVVVGNAQPTAEGVLSSVLNYHGFNFRLYIRYVFGRDQFNQALYNKVENIGFSQLGQNQDKRALTDRWKQPGDIVPFKRISALDNTPISSRFIQTENSFSGESINIGYEFRDKAWLNRASLSALSLNVYSNDLFYASTVRRERGIDYPFARSISTTIRVTFK